MNLLQIPRTSITHADVDVDVVEIGVVDGVEIVESDKGGPAVTLLSARGGFDFESPRSADIGIAVPSDVPASPRPNTGVAFDIGDHVDLSASQIFTDGSSDYESSEGGEIPYELSSAEYNNLQRFFKVFAKEKGHIDSEAFSKLMSAMGVTVNPQEAALIIKDLTDNANDKLEFFQFVQFMIWNRHVFKLWSRTSEEQGMLSTLEALKLKHSHRPDEPWRRAWDTIVLASILYFVVTVPFPDVLAICFVSDALFTIVLAMDMFVQPKTAYLDREEILVDDRLLLRRRYLRTWFLPDLLGTLPLGMISRIAAAPTQVVIAVSVIRYFLLLKVHRLFAVSKCDLFVTANYILFYFQIVPLMTFIFWSFTAISWITWIAKILGCGANYQQSLYWVLYTLSSVGYGDVPIDTTGQKILASILFVCSLLTNAVIIAKLGDVLQDFSVQHSNHIKMRETLTLLEFFGLDGEIKKDVLAMRHHTLRTSVTSSRVAALSSLPEALTDKLRISIHMSVISAVPLFSVASNDCLTALCQHLQKKICQPGEFIIITGEIGLEMFFLVHGVAEVITNEGIVVAKLHPGSFFGEVALLDEGVRRTASIRAISFCDLFFLTKADFQEITSRFPNFEQSVKAEAAKRGKAPAPKQKEASSHHQLRLFRTNKRIFNLGDMDNNNNLLKKILKDKAKETNQANKSEGWGAKGRSKAQAIPKQAVNELVNDILKAQSRVASILRQTDKNMNHLFQRREKGKEVANAFSHLF